MTEKKQSDFVVSDKRKFTSEGDLRPETASNPAEAPPEPVPPPVPPPVPAAPAPAEALPEAPPAAAPPPPSEAAAGDAQQSYRASGKRIDERIAVAGHPPEGFEITFEHL
ncbi:MAG TPA: hypothetical protein VGQ94_08855, partial [Terriglobales bacterium]|nr:hypothetical protein [Terriglobales bacterium]